MGFFIASLVIGFWPNLSEAPPVDRGVQSVFSPNHDSQSVMDYLQHFDSSSSREELGALSSDYLQERLSRILEQLQVSEVWENASWYFSYGSLRSEEASARKSHVFIAWKKEEQASSIKLEDLVRIFLDEKMAIIESVEDLRAWQLKRNQVMGALISLRKNESSREVIRISSATDFTDAPTSSGQEVFVTTDPLVLKISPQILVSSADLE